MISAVSLRYFAEVVRAGSIRGASERLHVAASAISRQMAMLEEQLGAPLLERGRGRTALRLTAAGELMVRHVNHLERESDRVRSEIEALKGLRKGHIRFGIPETFVREVIPQFLQRFNARYPGVTYQVEVAASTRLVKLVGRDELDVAVTFNPLPSLRVKHVYERLLKTCVLLSTDHPLAQRPWLKLSDLAAYGLAMPDHTMSAMQVYDDMFASARIQPRKVLVTNSYELMRSVAETGMAIALVNTRPGDSATTKDYRYVPIKDARVKPQRLTICTFEAHNPSPIAAVFIEALTKDFELLEHT
ncbi:MAG: LysR family transcriptional regulator [Variovorax sp.]|nr:LysR family transcriptional regulator [Variovorax sp.]